MHHIPTLTDGTVTLRAPIASDVRGSYEQSQDPESQRWTTVPLPYSMADADTYLHTVIPGGWESGAEWGFVVEAEGRFAGTFSLRPEGDGRAEVAFGTHPWARGRGYAERALRLLLEWGFTERALEVVHWRAYVGNWPSRRLAWRLGFRVEGTVRGLLSQRGALRDAWVGTLRRDDPRTPAQTWLSAADLVEADPGPDGARVRLRALRDDDAPRVVEGIGDPATQHWLGFMPRDPGPEQGAAYVEQSRLRLAEGHSLTWAFTDADDVLLGVVGLYRVDTAPELGYWTHPRARGRGLTVRAARLAVEHAFTVLGLPRLAGHVAVGNLASRRVLEAVGFAPVGVLRAAAHLGDGTPTDLAAYDLLPGEADCAAGAPGATDARR